MAADDARMEASAVPATVPIRRRRAWPAAAKPVGVDLSLVAVSLIFLVLTVAGFISGWETPFDAGLGAFIRWRLISNVGELAVWIGIVGVLGWWRSSGLVTGSVSLWGVLPIVALSAATLLTAGDAEELLLGPGIQTFYILSIVVAALGEEVVFRGFLLHGLTRRLGGSAAVLVSSLVFSAYHIPRMLIEEVGAETMEFRLISHFAFGVVLCRIRVATGSLLLPTAVHALWNLAAIGIAFWAYPEGGFPGEFWAVRTVLDTIGILLVGGLAVREVLVRGMNEVISGRRSGMGQGSTGGLVSAAKAYAAFVLFLTKPIPATAFERFTPAARRVIVAGHEVARRQRRRATDTDHLLLGLIHESDGLAATCLQASGLARGTTGQLDELLQTETTSPKVLPFSRRARLVLRLAICEADAWGDARIGTEHLLLGTTAVRVGGAVRLLRTADVRRKRLRRTLIAALSESAGSASDLALVPVDPVAG